MKSIDHGRQEVYKLKEYILPTPVPLVNYNKYAKFIF